jgi:hypothetical protein
MDRGDELRDYADTAALILLLDLVVTIDTSVAHLAGALGKPVWIMLQYSADWRWLLGRDDSPWYPTARLFRQHRRGDWDGVVADVAKELAAWPGSGFTPHPGPLPRGERASSLDTGHRTRAVPSPEGPARARGFVNTKGTDLVFVGCGVLSLGGLEPGQRRASVTASRTCIEAMPFDSRLPLPSGLEPPVRVADRLGCEGLRRILLRR